MRAAGGTRTVGRNKAQPTAQAKVSLSRPLLWDLLMFFSSYRQQTPVTEVMIFPDGTAYYVCPRCHITVDREFMRFCDRCGQHLGWKGYRKAKVVYPGQRNGT